MANPPNNNDSTEVMGIGLTRVASAQDAKTQSDVNEKSPSIEYDPSTKQRFYDTAPVPTKRLFASPLAIKGPYVRGGVRSIDDGWSSSHRALDYQVELGEPVYAMGDGTVVFVGYQSKALHLDLVNVEGAHADAHGNILSSNSTVVSTVDQIGLGGIVVQILHNGDFEGYRTEYYRLGSVDVSAIAPGNSVTEGQKIGTTGGTGGPTGFSTTSPILSLQISFVSGTTSSLVPPTSIVPNSWPGHQDSTTGAGISNSILMAPEAPFGSQMMSSFAAVFLQGADRGTSLQNQDTSDIKLAQARHATFIQQAANARLSSLYAATSAFKTQPLEKVSAPMVFDFDKGVWIINGVEQGPV
jgi:murein DD-endopeptidase MepM/ murein hydrolase activator NlpD